MSKLWVQFLSQSEVLEVRGMAKGPTVLDVRKVIAKNLRLPYSCVGLVDMSDVIILKDDFILQHPDIINVIRHPEERKVPADMRTRKPDITDATITDPRVLMSCNDALTPDNLYSYVQVTLKDGIPKLRCFKCNLPWEFDEVSKKSDMSKDEKIFWGAKLSMNALNKDDDIDAATCPVCGLFCQRIDTRHQAVRCFSCTRKGCPFDFCWDCRKPWNVGHSCKTLEEVQEILNNCQRKTMAYSNISNVPSVRACPKCKAMIEHIEACKQMECKFCKTNFCFVCLQVCNERTLACTSYNQNCTVAPVQNIIT